MHAIYFLKNYSRIHTTTLYQSYTVNALLVLISIAEIIAITLATTELW